MSRRHSLGVSEPMKRYSPIRRTRFERKRYDWRSSSTLKRSRLRVKPDPKMVAWSKAVRERDDYVCQYTGIRDEERNIAHHKAPRSQRKDLKYDVDNGVTLTPEAHWWVHTHPKEAVAMGLLNTESRELARKAA